jgi:hypothetical protein
LITQELLLVLILKGIANLVLTNHCLAKSLVSLL